MDSYFQMPVDRFNKSYPAGPYRFINREFFIISYRTDRKKLEEFVPEPLKVTDDIINFEFIRMPDSTGFGDYTESGQVIPVEYQGKPANFTISMFLDCYAPIAGGREIWGFPKKLAKPILEVEHDTLVGTLDYGRVRIATATMGYKYKTLDTTPILHSLQKPNFLIKTIPDVTGKPQICQLIKYSLEDIQVKGAWTGPCSLELHPHALANISYFEVKEIISAVHLLTDLTLPYGTVEKDYLLES
ncbi:MAG: acetoacetate decarboxylase [Legionellales bacterium]|nr:acetoacetate decarboxylase [Legionellales bacterium]